MPLGASSNLFRLVLEASPTGMLMADEDGIVVLVNEATERLFGYSRDDLVGLPLEVLVPARFRAGHPALRKDYAESPRIRAMAESRDLYGVAKNGEEIPLEIRLNPVTMEGRRYVLSSIVNVSERKLAAAALEASLKEKETLLREVHHRVKNNLQVISSLLNLQAATSDEQLKDRLLQVRDRIHSIAMIHESLYGAVDLARVNFADYLRRLTTNLGGLGAGRTEITVDAEGVMVPLDVAVPCGLIVNELVTNAVKHGIGQRNGCVRIVATHPNDAGPLTLTVRDNGVGLPDGLDPTTGGNMGMMIVATLIRQLGSSLRVKREGGTEISFDVPVHP
ncbi:MAG: PAS domain S-box protein [Myxococcales bacterium]|nr:PAS domain S-box protein [Myxococcales bacterium]